MLKLIPLVSPVTTKTFPFQIYFRLFVELCIASSDKIKLQYVIITVTHEVKQWYAFINLKKNKFNFSTI